MTDDSPTREPRDNRAPIPVSSTPRQPPWDLTLMVDKRGVEIGFGPQATGARVIILDEAAATTLFDALWMSLMSAHQVAVQQPTTDVTPREATVTTPAPPYRWTDVDDNPLALLCRVEQIRIDPQGGAMPARLRQQGQVVGWDTTWLHVRFDHDRALVVLRARLVRALDPSESR